MELGYKQILGYTDGLYPIQTQEQNYKKLRKKIREDIWKWGTFTTITHRKENINKPGTIKY